MKKYGFHHLFLGLPLAFVVGPLANAFYWFGKEMGEATMRAGGSKQALTNWKAWEPWDFITPSVAGYFVEPAYAAIKAFFS